MEFLPPRQSQSVPIRSRGELPHLYKPGGTYFITFRLADAVVPRATRCPPRIGDARQPIDLLDPAEIVGAYDPPITLGSCVLGDPRVATLVQNAMRHFDAQRYDLLAWCVMPNHVHAVVTPLAGYAPDVILHSWKSFSAHKANRLLGRSGPFWERESFDHLVRSIASLERFIRYVEQNPVAAGLCQTAVDWEFSSARCSLLRV